MTSTLAKPQPHQRQSSRPNSASSSSVVTIQRASSLSSRNGNGSHINVSGLRSQSPTQPPSIPTDLSIRTLSPDFTRHSPDAKRRSSAFYTRPDSRHGNNEGLGNLNRWSQSTASSISSANANRRGSFSKRLSGSFGSFSGFGSPQTASSHAKLQIRGQISPPQSPPRPQSMSPPKYPPPALPPIATLSSLSKAVDSADSPSTVTTTTPATADLLSPLTNPTNGSDYFGDRWISKSPPEQMSGRRLSTARAPRASIPSPVIIEQSRISGSRTPASVFSQPASNRFNPTERRPSQTTGYRSRNDSSRSSASAATGSGGTKRRSVATEGESSASDNRDPSESGQRRKAPSQKALLSKALAKANHAVILDGRQNIEGAVLAYGDACNLLRQVMIRSSGDDDRRKLEAVRNTYKNRIAELRNTSQSHTTADKALPERPGERDSRGSERLSIVTDDEEEEDNIDQAAMGISLGSQTAYDGIMNQNHRTQQPTYIPPRRQSLQLSARGTSNQTYSQQQLRMRYDAPEPIEETPLEPPGNSQQYMPPPLSSRRPLSPALPKDAEFSDEFNQSEPVRQDNGEHTSWLNTINESSGSSASSLRAQLSFDALRRKHVRIASNQTEAEFDAALDAAVEAAYDDGFEPDDDDDEDEQLMHDPQYQLEDPQPSSLSRTEVEQARETRAEEEREALVAETKQREKQRLLDTATAGNSPDVGYEYDEEADEEERMLEEMTRDYILDESVYGIKPALPRQSDSSGFSGRTWGSSIGSNPTSAGTSLSTVAEASTMPSMATQLKDHPLPPPIHPPPSGALPPPPVTASPSIPHSANGNAVGPMNPVTRAASPGVRDRRLSGMKRVQLKIETNAKLQPGPDSKTPKTQPPSAPSPFIPPQVVADPPKSALLVPEAPQTLPSIAFKPLPTSAPLPGSRKGSPPLPRSESPDMASSTASALTKVTSADSDTSVPSVPDSPRFVNKAATGLRKNFSSSSLRNPKLSISANEMPEASSTASLSSLTSVSKHRRVPSPAVPILPPPIDTSFGNQTQRMGSVGGMYLFDCDIHSPISAGSPNPLVIGAPLPLEPCPESALLRPFWFLRAIYQTIGHPRGGYLSNRLFVPRDIWRVKNIKLKNVEEKVSSCDLLTAALLKLGKVDTLDAGAVLEEMQFLESVMDQVQTNLSKKLGSDVGDQGAARTFKGSTGVDVSASNSEALTSKPTNSSNKLHLSSWRKLRSKNSLGPTMTSANTNGPSKDGVKEAPTMKSLPMTTMPNPRFPKREVTQVQCIGPNPSYMGALARLCDAVQILDPIARQVEDPGLRQSSQTHVGLELSTRHAAEFFGFYICRFVLTDVGIMLDKYIKRGSEWVMA